jgi:hypothetical protein
MTKFVFALAFLAAGAAQASSVKVDTVDAVYDVPGSSPANVSIESFKFEINQDLGRARLDITYQTDYNPGPDEGGYYGPGEDDVLVQGLSFDKTSSQVVYKSEAGKTTACANVTISHGPLGHRVHVKNTGLCTLSTSTEDVITDDGWEIKHHKVLNVFLNSQD